MSYPINVLFLCTGNSARSIMAEAILSSIGQGKFKAFSAGSTPTGQVNPYALDVLQKNGHDTSGFISKSWDIFNDIEFDYIFTLCDNAKNEACPVWLGKPITDHWGFSDPAAADETEKEVEFLETYQAIKQKIKEFICKHIS